MNMWQLSQYSSKSVYDRSPALYLAGIDVFLSRIDISCSRGGSSLITAGTLIKRNDAVLKRAVLRQRPDSISSLSFKPWRVLSETKAAVSNKRLLVAAGDKQFWGCSRNCEGKTDVLINVPLMDLRTSLDLQCMVKLHHPKKHHCKLS